ncbi:hypothetical protein H8356DRAFT_1312458 [Neocallimastix lanati (nom. inval.)]|jgi:hypothetical protein|uniref:Small-subunit processome Utp12 domain-containing protein n=1 Tax=Neocallimastix californiae TaxID=1754190 RepID=A0A1Y1YXW4_9FUNG|nr:hypothetical protein H8356DRAFT_1312458 [Neocallimastix sp. JGI-2020a]ORY02863.1 hypothetical protein LY90DRAFT_678600 [Neocallimastix californiae]|eukprot:ORY02863.1 hypothetical protein LY90DRAFT_678600 [Neocallimastix californiae]
MEKRDRESMINTFLPILQKSLVTNDREIFDQCMEIKNKKIIIGIVKKLLKTEINSLTKKLITSIEKEPTRGNAPEWLRITLLIHAPILLKSKEIVFRLDDLYNKISNGNGTIGKMLQLSGRLDMMNVQLHSNRKDSFEDIEEEEEEESETSESDDEDSNDEEKEFDIYEEEEEDDEDEDEDKEDEDEDEEKENKKNEIVDDVFGVTDFSFLKEIK